MLTPKQSFSADVVHIDSGQYGDHICIKINAEAEKEPSF